MSPRAQAALLALVGALLLAGLATGPGAAAAADADNASTTYAVQLADNGDARWNVTVTFPLDSAAERAAFADLAADFEAGETGSLGLEAFRAGSREAATVTGRAMQITDVERARASPGAIENGTGWLSVSFTWTNFAQVRENGDLVVGDAFNSSQGTWLSWLGANETLIVTPPPDHSPFSGDGEVTAGSFRWEGPRSFDSGSPSAVFTGDAVEEPDESPTPILILAVLAALLIAVVALAWRRGALASGEPAATEDGSTAQLSTEEPAEAPSEEADSGVDVELLSDEERVEWLLEKNGGRMKQATIVKETGWSNAKVSQLLSAMEDDDRIHKLRIGRENLISFPDEDVTDIDE